MSVESLAVFISAKHGTQLVGKSDERETEVKVTLLPSDNRPAMFLLGKFKFRYSCLHFFFLLLTFISSLLFLVLKGRQ